MCENTRSDYLPQDRLLIELPGDSRLFRDLMWFVKECESKNEREDWLHASTDHYPLQFKTRENNGYCRETIVGMGGWNVVGHFSDPRFSKTKRLQSPDTFYEIWDEVLDNNCGKDMNEILDLTTHMNIIERKSAKEYNDLTSDERVHIGRFLSDLAPQEQRLFQ